MMHTNFGGDFLVFQWCFIGKQLHFLCGRKMENMQSCPCFFGKCDGFGRRKITSFFASNKVMRRYRNFVPIFGFVFFKIVFDGLFVFAMHGNQHRGA